jgi:heme/copper-type cytochrome/quinol oxidase subunit 2
VLLVVVLRQLIVIATSVTAAVGCAQSPPPSPRADLANPTVRSCMQTAHGASWQGLTPVRGGTASVDAHDDYFVATCLVVPWDKPVRLTVTNRGHLPHDMTIPGVGLRTAVDAGQTVFVMLPATKVPLRFVCSYHVSQHMFGAIVPLRPGQDSVDDAR